jgi:hypothetical protein
MHNLSICTAATEVKKERKMAGRKEVRQKKNTKDTK